MPPAVIAAGVGLAGAGASIISSSNASKAAKNAADAQTQAAADATAEQAREFDYIQQNNAYPRAVGNAALGAVASGFGLPVSMTGQTTPAAATPAAASLPGVSMTGPAGSGAPNVPAAVAGRVYAPGDASWQATPPSGGMDVVTNPDGSIGYQANTAPSMTNADAQAILAARPDVANSQWLASVAPVVVGDRNGDGTVDATDRAIYWYENYGKGEGMTLPSQAPAAPAAASGTPAGYADPTAPSGYTSGPRAADYGTQPTYAAPAPLDVSLSAYQESPDYQFRLQQGQTALDHLAAAGGGLMSGARAKALDRYNQDYATTDYNNWRDYTTNQYNNNRAFDYNSYLTDLGQYNTNRNVSNGLYEDDRNYLTSRYDTRNNQLMQLAGFGSNATASDNAAAQSFAANAGNNLMTAGNAAANGYINSANAWTNGINNVMTTGSYLTGQLIGSGKLGFGSNGGYGGFNAGGAMFNPSTSYNFGA